MKRKRLFTLLLTGILVLPAPYSSVMAAEFSDGVSAENLESTQVFSSGEAEEDKPVDEVIGYVTYLYNEETDSYVVDEVTNTLGGTIYLERELHGRKVTEIGNWIYRECFEGYPEPAYLGELVLPDTITKIAASAFRDGQMTRMDLPDSVTEIGQNAFLYCGQLKFLHFSAGTKVFPAGIFKECKSLDTIEIPQGVTAIESGAMKGCPALSKVYIAESVAEIGEDLFDEGVSPVIYGKAGSYAETYAASHGLEFVAEGEEEPGQPQDEVVADGVKYSYQEDTDSYMAIGFEANIPEEVSIPETINEKKVSGIGEGAFKNCTLLKKIELPSSLEVIPASAFENCTSLEEITIKDGVKEIGEKAFAGCLRLKALILPDTVESIGQRAFYQCIGLNEMKLPSHMEQLEVGIFYETSIYGTLEVPEGVRVMKKDVFEQCQIDELVLSDTVTTIESDAFSMASIKRIVIPASVTEIGERIVIPSWDPVTLVVEPGSYAETYAKEHGLTYENGIEGVGVPVVKGAVSGNNIRLALNGACANASFYDYVLTKDKNFPSTGNYMYCQEKSTALQQDFETLAKGTYYLFARAGRETEDGDEYSAWSQGVKVTVSIQAPASPKVQKVTVKGSTVTVTVKQVSGTKGYGIVLSTRRTKNGCQKLLKPYDIRYASKNNKSTTYVFKNVKSGSYCVIARSYTKASNGKNVYSKWSGYYQMISVSR